jgi:hypothetical protein
MKQKIKILVLFVFLTGGAFVFTRSGEMQTKPVETAGQRFKNIKVLNDMPADQMGKVMNIMSASLGVNCNFCHVENDFSKDDKEEKQMAREMIKMTFALNKDYFNGRPEISCNTCHNGKTHPQNAPNLNAVAMPEERPKQPATKPTIEQILEKYTAASGGAGAAKITSRVITAQRVEPDGKTVEQEEILQKGGKMLLTTTYDSKERGKFIVVESWNGESARKTGNQKDIPLKTDEAEQIKRGAQIFSYADLKTIYSKLEYRFTDKIDGREVYLVTATTADNSRERLYFDAQTGLLVRRVSSVPTVLGAFQYQVDYADYKDFGGAKLPTTIRYSSPNVIYTRKITDVKTNQPVDDAKFMK